MASLECWRDRWALVTGASSGIGQALAEELAAAGAKLVLTARRRQRLAQFRKLLHEKQGIQVEAVAADLSQPEGPAEIFAFTRERGMEIELLVNNAGLGAYGAFAAAKLERQLEMIQVNCSAMVHLTRLYLPGMIQRRRGDILILASTAAYQGVPYLTTYAATKAFDLLFAEALAAEVKHHGVRVCALCPGNTVSEFQDVAGVPKQLGKGGQSAAEVARVGLQALASGEYSVISGLTNWLGVELQRIAPRRMVTTAAERLFRPAK